MSTLTNKHWRTGTERAVSPQQTLNGLKPLLARLGISRVANLTGLDRIGIPVYAVYRPESRSLSVAQGKGVTLEAAQVSGLMESLELYHAERFRLPLLLGSWREMTKAHLVADVSKLAKLSTSSFHADFPLLWATATDLVSGNHGLVPYELVHTDFRSPLPSGSGAFLMSSNGLASGNILLEAISHALCELVERDANALWHVGGAGAVGKRVDLQTIDDSDCRAVLDQYERAEIDVAVWDTTTDVGIPSFLATVLDRNEEQLRLMPPLSGSGCHPRKHIGLLRALTEAAQGRLTMISGARDDWSPQLYDPAFTHARWRAEKERIQAIQSSRSFTDIVDSDNDGFEADLDLLRDALVKAGHPNIWVVNLTDPDIGIPVVRAIVPGLESMSEITGLVLGQRAQRVMRQGLQ